MPKIKNKEERLEKVVEYDDKAFISFLAFVLLYSSTTTILFFCKENLTTNANLVWLIVTGMELVLFLFRILDDRKVYWRKIK